MATENVAVAYAKNGVSGHISEIGLYLKQQKRLDAIETLKHFKTIVELLKINPLESNTHIYQGKNIHQLVLEIDQELSQYQQGSFVEQETKQKIGLLYVTKKMNPPFYFSWEFMAGTYLPFMSPFVISLMQVLQRYMKKKYKERNPKKKSVEDFDFHSPDKKDKAD